MAGTIEIADSNGEATPISLAPLVFLGRCPEVEESRAVAEATLSRLRSEGTSVREIVRFDVSGVVPGRADSSPSPRGNVIEGDDSQWAGVPERFTFEVRSDMIRPTPAELARARQWGARVSGRYRAKRTANSDLEVRTPEPVETGSRSVQWCGATE